MNIRSNGRLNWKAMSRPAANTRGAVIKAAVHLFAEKGFQATSVRDIIVKARVNQAAINYHFKGKDGLYLEVLKTALRKLTEHAGFGFLLRGRRGGRVRSAASVKAQQNVIVAVENRDRPRRCHQRCSIPKASKMRPLAVAGSAL
jgi:AcrR family transcriptional regulator